MTGTASGVARDGLVFDVVNDDLPSWAAFVSLSTLAFIESDVGNHDGSIGLSHRKSLRPTETRSPFLVPPQSRPELFEV